MSNRAVDRARLITLGFLGALFVARCADAAVHSTFGYLPFVAALFVLPVWHVSGVAAPAWTRWQWWLLAGQAALTYAPFQPALNAGIWVVIAFACNAVALFGLSRLSQVVLDLREAQDELPAAVVDRERLAAEKRLRRSVGDRIQRVAQHARAALRWLSTTAAGGRRGVRLAAGGVSASRSPIRNSRS